MSTCGLDYYPLTYKLSDGSLLNVHIRDTCGQERYDSINEQYYKTADGILLVFDITDEFSFSKIKTYYVKKIKEECKIGIPIILLGNKTDLENERKVLQEEAIDLSINEEYIYKETSCIKNENVADAFETIIEIWNISNKKNNQNSIKRTKSKDNLNTLNSRTSSFSLTERSYSNKKSINESWENKSIHLHKKNKKKKKKFC